MGSLRLETLIPLPLERCFDLARSVEVHCATAAFTGERVVQPGRTSGLLERGDLVTFEARHLGWRRRLTAEVVELDRPRWFADEMRRGAFGWLRHEHEFEPADGGTLMRDRLDWRVPGGPFGAVIGRLLVTPHMRWFMLTKQTNLKRYVEAGGALADL
jgi:ligand-binding SRPBCC domain-containing protein